MYMVITVCETNFHQHMIDIIMPNSDSKLANSLILHKGYYYRSTLHYYKHYLYIHVSHYSHLANH